MKNILVFTITLVILASLVSAAQIPADTDSFNETQSGPGSILFTFYSPDGEMINLSQVPILLDETDCSLDGTNCTGFEPFSIQNNPTDASLPENMRYTFRFYSSGYQDTTITTELTPGARKTMAVVVPPVGFTGNTDTNTADTNAVDTNTTTDTNNTTGDTNNTVNDTNTEDTNTSWSDNVTITTSTSNPNDSFGEVTLYLKNVDGSDFNAQASPFTIVSTQCWPDRYCEAFVNQSNVNPQINRSLLVNNAHAFMIKALGFEGKAIHVIPVDDQEQVYEVIMVPTSVVTNDEWPFGEINIRVVDQNGALFDANANPITIVSSQCWPSAYCEGWVNDSRENQHIDRSLLVNNAHAYMFKAAGYRAVFLIPDPEFNNDKNYTVTMVRDGNAFTGGNTGTPSPTGPSRQLFGDVTLRLVNQDGSLFDVNAHDTNMVRQQCWPDFGCMQWMSGLEGNPNTWTLAADNNHTFTFMSDGYHTVSVSPVPEFGMEKVYDMVMVPVTGPSPTGPEQTGLFGEVTINILNQDGSFFDTNARPMTIISRQCWPDFGCLEWINESNVNSHNGSLLEDNQHQFTFMADGFQSVTIFADPQFNNPKTYNVVMVSGSGTQFSDTSAPQVAITSPTAGSVVASSTYNLSVNTNESAVCTYAIDGGANTSFSTSTGLAHSGSAISSNGNHTLAVSCTDNYGNTATQSTDFAVNADSGGQTTGEITLNIVNQDGTPFDVSANTLFLDETDCPTSGGGCETFNNFQVSSSQVSATVPANMAITYRFYSAGYNDTTLATTILSGEVETHTITMMET